MRFRDDFKQKEGTKSRRIADQLPLKIKVPATIEWSPHIYGNGVMMMASAWPDPVKQEDGKVAVFRNCPHSRCDTRSTRGG